MAELIDTLTSKGSVWLVGAALTVIYLAIVLLVLYVGALVAVYGCDWVRACVGWLKGRA